MDKFSPNTDITWENPESAKRFTLPDQAGPDANRSINHHSVLLGEQERKEKIKERWYNIFNKVASSWIRASYKLFKGRYTGT